MKKILLVLLLIISSVYSDMNIKKITPVKVSNVTVMGVTIDKKFDNTNKLFIQTTKHGGQNHYDVYSRKLSTEFSPYEQIYVIVNPSSSKVVGLNILYPRFNKSMDDCVKDKNLFLDNAFEKYGGQFENQYDIITKSNGNQVSEANLFIDHKHVFYVCSKDADLVFLSPTIQVMNQEYQEYLLKMFQQYKTQTQEELQKLENEKNEKYKKMFQ